MNSTSLASSHSVLLIGDGRLATHMRSYLSQTLGSSSLATWSRRKNSSAELSERLSEASIIALAISDSALRSFFEKHSVVAPQVPWVHFSGALEIEGMTSLHPLMTFGPSLYSLDEYRALNFVTTGEPKWPQALPLINSLFEINPEEKSRYHALCVLGGNFSTMLWQKTQFEFQRLGLPPDILRSYAERGLQNVFANPQTALTGPLARKDLHTQEKNIASLEGDAFQKVYRAFQEAFDADPAFRKGNTL